MYMSVCVCVCVYIHKFALTVDMNRCAVKKHISVHRYLRSRNFFSNHFLNIGRGKLNKGK